MRLDNLKNLTLTRRVWLPVLLVVAAIAVIGGGVLAATALSNIWRSPTIHVTPVVNPPTVANLLVSSPDFTTDQSVVVGSQWTCNVSLQNTGTANSVPILMHYRISKVGGTALAASDLSLQYDADPGTDESWQALTPTLAGGYLEGTFGPSPDGFVIPTNTTNTTPIRATFQSVGDYSVDVWAEAASGT